MTTRRERVEKIKEFYEGKNMEIIPSSHAMRKFWEILLPEAIEIAKEKKQQNIKNIS